MPVQEVEFRAPPVDEALVEQLEALLGRAKSGAIESLCFVHLDRDRRVYCYMSDTDNWLEQVGMVHVLKSDLETKSTREAVRNLGGDC